MTNIWWGNKQFFLSTVNATGVCKNFLFKNVLMQLSTSLMGNAFFLKICFKWLTPVWNLEACSENQVILKILIFHVSNLQLKTSGAYHACQLKLLLEEIALKRSRTKTLEKGFNTRRQRLRGTLGIIGYTHVFCLFLSKNDKKLNNR